MKSSEEVNKCILISKDSLNFSYNKIIANLLRTKEVTIPPRNKYIAPHIKHIKPFIKNTLGRLGFSPEAYKNYYYFSIKERLKLSKNNVLTIPKVGNIFIHRTKPDKNYHGDRRLRPDICIKNIKEILIKLNKDNIRFFETYYCDEEVLAIEYIENPVSLYKVLYKEQGKNKEILKNTYQEIYEKIIDYCGENFGEPIWGLVYNYDENYEFVLDLGEDNILFEGWSDNNVPNLILMDIFYLKEK